MTLRDRTTRLSPRPEHFQYRATAPSCPYSLSAVRTKAVISTAIPTDATAKNILGMSATIALDPCATLTISAGSGRSQSRHRNARKALTPGRTPAFFIDNTYANWRWNLRRALTKTKRKTPDRGQSPRRGDDNRIVAPAHVRCTTFFVNARRRDERDGVKASCRSDVQKDERIQQQADTRGRCPALITKQLIDFVWSLRLFCRSLIHRS